MSCKDKGGVMTDEHRRTHLTRGGKGLEWMYEEGEVDPFCDHDGMMQPISGDGWVCGDCSLLLMAEEREMEGTRHTRERGEVMRFDEYQRLAARTIRGDLSDADHKAMCLLGLIGEVGEVVDYLKKAHAHDHGIHHERLAEEIGDVWWYVSASAQAAGFALSEVTCDERCPVVYQDELALPRLRRCETDRKEGMLVLGGLPMHVVRQLLIAVGRLAQQDKMQLTDLARVALCLTWLCCEYELDLNAILHGNISKLKARYPEGFASERSKAREGEEEDVPF